MQNLTINNKEKLEMTSNYHLIILRSVLFLSIVLLAAGNAFADNRTKAKRIHDRLTGTAPSTAVLNKMVDLIDGTTTVAASDYPNAVANATLGASAGEIAAAYVAMENKNFYNATLVNLITPWTNEARAVFPEDMDDEGILNDYTTTVIGVVRDDDDFRKILFDDVLYIGNTSRPELSTGYSYSSNAHFQQLQDSGLNLGFVQNPNPTVVGPDSVDPANDVLLKVSQAANTGGVLNNTQTAGVMTTRAGAKAFFVDGTNRAMFRFTVLNHLCNDMEQLKDATLPADRIRQDVSRSPGGDSRIYMNECIGCHTTMDPMTQAFAYYEYNKSTTTLEFTDGVVQAKNLINADNFKPGYITTDDSWINYWRQGKNSVVGDNVTPNTSIPNWNATPLTVVDGEGSGAKSMGQELAYSEMFARCQVEKVFQAVCLRKPGNSTDHTAVNSILSNFKSSYMVNSGPGYELKQVFAETAAYCKGP